MRDFLALANFLCWAALFGWFFSTLRKPKRDSRVEFYDDIQSLAARVHTMNKFAPGASVQTIVKRADGCRFRMTIEQLEDA